MQSDSFFSDDLAELLKVFPPESLHILRAILHEHWSLTPFPLPRAETAHQLPPDADLRPHAAELAKEILWWGSNEILQQFGHQPSWKEIVADVAKSVRVTARKRATNLPVWDIEAGLLEKVLSQWESMTPEQREVAISRSSGSIKAARGIGAGAVGGGLAAAAEFAGGIAANIGGKQLIEMVAGRAGFAGLGILGVALGAGLAAYDLAGPSYRVLRPVALAVAMTRQKLRDEALADIFRE